MKVDFLESGAFPLLPKGFYLKNTIVHFALPAPKVPTIISRLDEINRAAAKHITPE